MGKKKIIFPIKTSKFIHQSKGQIWWSETKNKSNGCLNQNSVLQILLIRL